MKGERFKLVNVRDHPDRRARRSQILIPFQKVYIAKSKRREILDRRIRELIIGVSLTKLIEGEIWKQH